MDLLDLLLRDSHADARLRLHAALSRPEPGPSIQEIAFDIYEVVLDREVGEARVYDVLDGGAEPTVVTLDELRTRLG